MSKRHVFLSLVLASSALVAEEQFSDVYFNDDCFCQEQPTVVVRGEYLLFQTTWDQPHYVVSATDSFVNGEHYPLGTRHVNNPPFKSGFRVEALYQMCDRPNDIDLRFTWLQSSHTNKLAGAALWDTKGFPGDGAQASEDTPYSGAAEDSVNFHYYGGDLTFNRISPGCCGENFTFLVGLHFAYVKFKENFASVGSFSETSDDDVTVTHISNQLQNKSRFWGIGPQFGIDYKYDIWSMGNGNLTFVANARAALLASSTQASFNDTTIVTPARAVPVNVSLRNETYWRVTPAFDARLGFSSNFDCFCLTGNIEFGYEFIYYSNCIDNIVGYDVAYAGDSMDVYSNLNSQGPYVAITLGF